MKKIFVILPFLALFAISSTANAQRALTEQEKSMYQERILDVVNDFNARVSELWRSPTRLEKQDMERFRANKKTEINAALALFIGKGKEYDVEEIREVWDGQRYVNKVVKQKMPAVKMETSSVNTTKIFRQTVESYLIKVSKNVASRVEISACDAYFASDLKEVAPGRYEASVAFVQDFMRFNSEGTRVYADRTTKVIRVYLTAERRAGREVFVVELGDIRVVDTRRL